MTRARILTIASTAIIATLLSLAFLAGQPIPAAGSAVGFTSTFTPLPPTDTPIPTPTDTPVPPPTDTPEPPPPPPSEPQPTALPTPTFTPVPILPLSGGEAGQAFAALWILGGAVLVLGWLLRRLVLRFRPGR